MSKLNEREKKIIMELRNQDLSYREIARKIGVTHSTVSRYISDWLSGKRV